MIKVGGDRAVWTLSPDDIDITLSKATRKASVFDDFTESLDAVDITNLIFELVIADGFEDSTDDAQIG